MSNIPLLSYEMVGYSLYKNSVKSSEDSDHNKVETIVETIVETNVNTIVETNVNSSDADITSVVTSVEEPVCKSSSQTIDIESVIGLVVEEFFCYDIVSLESFFSIFL